jgi:hypothetical protein
VTKHQQPPGARTCKGRNKQGDPCRSTFVGASGYCTAHDPERKVDMRELGHRGGKARRQGVAEQLPGAERQSLRQFLRDGLDHETIKAAIERSLAGGNESARVACVKFLSDLELYRKDGGDECPRCAAAKADGPAARARVNEWIAGLVEGAVRDVFGAYRTEAEALRDSAPVRESHDSQAMKLVREAVMRGLDGREDAFQDAVETAVDRVLDAISRGLVVDNVVPADRAAEILAGLEEMGLIAGRGRIDELAQRRAEELTRAFCEEHGLPMPPVAA